MRKNLSLMIIVLLLMGAFTLAFRIQPAKTETTIITVPDDYPTIQEAINAADSGDTIFVRNGTYYENVVVSKTVSLIGENMNTTVIDGNQTANCVTVEADNVTISNFKLQYPSSDEGYLIAMYNCQGIRVVNNNLRTARCKVLLQNCSYCVVEDNYVPGGWIAIMLSSSNRNRISNNFILGCTQYTLPIGPFYAIRLHNSDMNCIEQNIIADCDVGIHLLESSNNTIRSNIICDDYIPAYYPSDGIWLESSSYNLIIENRISDMRWSALTLDQCNDTVIYHNNFINNEYQVYLGESYNNTWDDGYPSGGNYWSDYTGADVKSSPNQDLPNSDGIGDTPYTIDASNSDHYPLMKPYGGAHDIGITVITTSKTIVGEGYNVSISVKMLNYGINTETFNLTVYANETILTEIVSLTLTGRTPITLNYTWNTTGFAYGNYTIWAYAESVEGETYLDDNTFVDGFVTVVLAGDLNIDGIVDYLDINPVCRIYGKTPQDPDWNPNCDIVEDEIIDYLDINVLCRNYGKTYP